MIKNVLSQHVQILSHFYHKDGFKIDAVPAGELSEVIARETP